MMKFPMIILLSLTFSLAVSTATLAQSAEDEQAIRDQLARFYEGYNEHDADKMVSIYADDADHINVFAEWRKGKPAVREALKRLHAGPGKNDHKTYTIEKIRFIKPDVAVIQVRSLSKPCACGNLSTFVMTKESGKWLVVSFANVEYKLDPKGDKTGITKMPSKVPAGGQLLVVPSGAGQKLANGNEWKIMGGQSGGRLAIMEVQFASTSDHSRQEPHIHTREEEGWYVIDGELEFEVGDRTATAGPGTLVWAPRNIQHRYRITKAPVRYLLIFSPAGMEGLFKDVEDLRKLKLGELEFRKEKERRQAKYGVRAGALPLQKGGN